MAKVIPFGQVKRDASVTSESDPPAAGIPDAGSTVPDAVHQQITQLVEELRDATARLTLLVPTGYDSEKLQEFYSQHADLQQQLGELSKRVTADPLDPENNAVLQQVTELQPLVQSYVEGVEKLISELGVGMPTQPEPVVTWMPAHWKRWALLGVGVLAAAGVGYVIYRQTR